MDTVTKGIHRRPRSMVNRLLTADEVARRLHISKAAVYEAARQDRIGGLVRIGRRIRFDAERFQAWLDNGGESLPGGWRMQESR